jgi:hypothetical protein
MKMKQTTNISTSQALVQASPLRLALVEKKNENEINY